MKKTYDIKNSAGKVTGKVTYEDFKFFIDNAKKPILEISEKEIVQKLREKNKDLDFLLYLYNELTLNIGEIAAIYEVCYSNINKLYKKIPNWKADAKGRRNRAYGHPVSKSQSEKMSKSLKGREAPYYERTPEIRKKISDSLKEYFKENPQNPEPHRKNWRKGVYDNVDFHIGIGGSIFSLKNNKKIRFRSLLELFFMLKLEESEINNYLYEPIHIALEDGRSYTPDFLVNNTIIELKSKKYIERKGGEVLQNFLYKKEQAEKYCNKNNLKYKVIFDEDIEFDSRRMKHFIKDNPQIVKKYNITFINPERMV